jgi:hypothetical protein
MAEKYPEFALQIKICKSEFKQAEACIEAAKACIKATEACVTPLLQILQAKWLSSEQKQTLEDIQQCKMTDLRKQRLRLEEQQLGMNKAQENIRQARKVGTTTVNGGGI